MTSVNNHLKYNICFQYLGHLFSDTAHTDRIYFVIAISMVIKLLETVAGLEVAMSRVLSGWLLDSRIAYVEIPVRPLYAASVRIPG